MKKGKGVDEDEGDDQERDEDEKVMNECLRVDSVERIT
jgi:hypothetical protein